MNPPYMDKVDNGNVSGIFPPILRLVVHSCCGVCAVHGHTEIDFRSAGDKQPAMKNTQTEVKKSIDDVTELNFPIYGRMDQTDYSNEYGFAPLVQSAGVVFIVAEDEPGAAAKTVVKAVFDLWPLIITVFISAFFAGIVMWLLVSFLFVFQKINLRAFRTHFIDQTGEAASYFLHLYACVIPSFKDTGLFLLRNLVALPELWLLLVSGLGFCLRCISYCFVLQSRTLPGTLQGFSSFFFCFVNLRLEKRE